MLHAFAPSFCPFGTSPQLELSLQALQTSVCEQVDRVVFICETLADNVREARSEERQIYRRETEERQYAFDSLGARMAAELQASHSIRSTCPVEVSPILSPQSIGENATGHDGTRQRDMSRAHSSSAYRFETSDNMLEREAPREDSRRPRAERWEEATPQRRQVSESRPVRPAERPLSEASEGPLSSISPLPTAIRKDVPISAAPTKQAPAQNSPARKDTSKETPARKVDARETPRPGPRAKKAPAKKASAKKAPLPSAKRATNKYGSSSKKRHLPADKEGDEDEERDGSDRRGEGPSSRRDAGEASPSEDRPSSPLQELPKRRGRKRKGSISAPKRSRSVCSDSEYVATGLVSNVAESSATGGHRYSTRARGKAPKVAGVWF